MEKLKVNYEVENDDKLLNEMKKAYAACPAAVKYCNEIGIPEELIDDNITKIFDFVCDINYCRSRDKGLSLHLLYCLIPREMLLNSRRIVPKFNGF